MFAGMIIMTVLVVALAAVLVALGISGSRDGDEDGGRKVLAERRYAAGEPDKREFHARQAGHRRSPQASARWPQRALIVVAIVLVALLAVLIGVILGLRSTGCRC